VRPREESLPNSFAKRHREWDRLHFGDSNVHIERGAGALGATESACDEKQYLDVYENLIIEPETVVIVCCLQPDQSHTLETCTSTNKTQNVVSWL